MSVKWQSPGGTWGRWITGVQLPHGLLCWAKHLKTLLKKTPKSTNDFIHPLGWSPFSRYFYILIPMLDPFITQVVPPYLSLEMVPLHSSATSPGYISVPILATGCLVCSSAVAFWLGIPYLFKVSYRSVILSSPYLISVCWRIGIFRGSWYLCGTSIYLWGPPYFMPLRIHPFMATLSSFGAIPSLV